MDLSEDGIIRVDEALLRDVIPNVIPFQEKAKTDRLP